MTISDKRTAYQVNRDIEAMIDAKGLNPKKYTSDARSFLAQYTGYGGLQEVGADGSGILYEFYTPQVIIQKMWGMVIKAGFRGGKVLEPAAGIGDFIRYMPSSDHFTNDVSITAIEPQPYSHRITQILYPFVNAMEGYFEQQFINDKNESVKSKVTDEYDLVIGNPPYGSIQGFQGGKYFNMGEDAYSKAQSYDEYFILRGLDKLRSGGLLCYIIGAEVANGATPWLDKANNPTKEMIDQRGFLLDAWRLPNGVFDRTDVLSDILLIQKR